MAGGVGGRELESPAYPIGLDYLFKCCRIHSG